MTKPTAAEVLAEAENPAHLRVESAFILQRQDLQTAYEQLQAEQRAAARLHGGAIGNAELSAIDRRLAELEAEISEALIEFQFKSIGYQVWTDLIRKHPPATKEQKAQGHDTNPDTHRPAALAASCVSPEGADAAFFARIASVYSPAQFEALWLACWKANMGTSTLPKAVSARLGLSRGSTEPSGISALPMDEESPPASS
jgi:hypothetical protein